MRQPRGKTSSDVIDVMAITHNGGITYLDPLTGRSATVAHPTISELMERVAVQPPLKTRWPDDPTDAHLIDGDSAS